MCASPNPSFAPTDQTLKPGDDARQSESSCDVSSIVPSVVPSVEADDEEPPVEVVTSRDDASPAAIVASTPSTFAGLYPSTRPLVVQHDASVDGNMNLRIDIVAGVSVVLYYLRMYDLYHRRFSLRRYCRESGREVCHSRRRYAPARPPSPERSTKDTITKPQRRKTLGITQPPLTRAASIATGGLRRIKSAYGSRDAIGPNWDESPPTNEPTDTILLEFTNYAHVDLQRQSYKGLPSFAFEYWGVKYRWRRMGGETSGWYRLYRGRRSDAIAHVVSIPKTPSEVTCEKDKGGWVPACRLWISDPTVFCQMKDVADVIVATGVVALVDDAIRAHWPFEESGSRANQVPGMMDRMLFHRDSPSPSGGPRRRFSLRRLFGHG